MTRRARLLALLWTKNDYEHTPLGSKAFRQAKRGAAPTSWRLCERCDGDKTVPDRYKRAVPCPQCNGRGRTRVDDMTGLEVVTDDAKLTLGELIRRDTRYVPCPDCQGLDNEPTGVIRGERCRRCDGTGRAALPGSWLSEPVDERDRLEGDAEAAMLNTIERRREQGSYHELDEALALLPSRWRRLVVGVHVERLPLILDSEEHLILEAGLKTLEFLMPDTIRVPAQVKAAVKHAASRADRTLANGRGAGKVQLDKRDKEIRKLVRQGRPTQWVAGEYALSVASVNRIVNGEETAA